MIEAQHVSLGLAGAVFTGVCYLVGRGLRDILPDFADAPEQNQ